MTKSAKEIASFLKGRVEGDPSVTISGLGSVESAKEGQLVCIFAKEHVSMLSASKASCAVVKEGIELQPSNKTLIRTPDPKMALFQLLNLYNKPYKKAPGIHNTAIIEKSAKIGKDVYIGPSVVIEGHAIINDNSIIEAGVFIGEKTVIGRSNVIYPNVAIYHNCSLGNNVIIHSSTVVGSDGFGYVQMNKARIKIPQIGSVIIKDNVEIGSNCSIDRATVGYTVIGEGTKVDNLVQIAHNVKIGKNVVIAGESGIAGSTVIGDNVTIAAQVGIKDHIWIGDNAVIAAKSAVKDNIEPGKIVAGVIPATDARQFARELAAIRKLGKIIGKVLRLIKESDA